MLRTPAICCTATCITIARAMFFEESFGSIKVLKVENAERGQVRIH
jgi:hypothetical protein